MNMNHNPSPRTTDERFYTPRAQVSTGRSTQSGNGSLSFGTPRTARSSLTDGDDSVSVSFSEYGTPRYWENISPHGSRSATDTVTANSTSNGYHQSHHSSSNQDSYPHSNSHLHSHSRRGSRSHNHHPMIPPQYPTRISRAGNYSVSSSGGYQYGSSNYNSEGDVESQCRSASSDNRDEEDACGVDVPPNDYSQQDITNVFSYARHGRVEEVDNLLLRGVPIDIRDDNGNTILLISCQNGNKRLVKLALRYGADMNICNFKGNSALHFCYRYGYAKTLGLYLLRKGADDSIRNLNGETCEDLGGTEG